MVRDLGRRALDNGSRPVAGDGGKLTREAHVDLGVRSGELRRLDGCAVNRNDRRGKDVARGRARTDRVVEIGEGFGRHQSPKRRGVAGGKGVHNDFVGRASTGQEGLRRKAPVLCGDGVEAAPGLRVGDAGPAFGRRRRGDRGNRGRGIHRREGRAGRWRTTKRGKEPPGRAFRVAAHAKHRAKLVGDEQGHKGKNDSREVDLGHLSKSKAGMGRPEPFHT
jgi:hypothetical protein